MGVLLTDDQPRRKWPSQKPTGAARATQPEARVPSSRQAWTAAGPLTGADAPCVSAISRAPSGLLALWESDHTGSRAQPKTPTGFLPMSPQRSPCLVLGGPCGTPGRREQCVLSRQSLAVPGHPGGAGRSAEEKQGVAETLISEN